MKVSSLAIVAVAAGIADAQKAGGAKGKMGGGGGAKGGASAGTPVGGKTPGVLTTGPYKAAFWSDPGLSRHTIFAPTNMPAGAKMPAMVWGNGACSGNGTYFRRSLFQVASQGFFVIANGSPNGGGGQTTSKLQTQALDWIQKNAGKGQYANLDATRIAAAGQSCGGLETYDAAMDKRVSFVGIFNSGEFGNSVRSKRVTKPIFYFLGGPSDMAQKNGERDYKNLPSTAVKWKGDMPVGHMATWSQTNGGKFGKAEWMWLDWTLRGNKAAEQFFIGGGAKADGWSVEHANMANIKVFPPYANSGAAAAAPAAAPKAAKAPKGAAPAAPAPEPAAEAEAAPEPEAAAEAEPAAEE